MTDTGITPEMMQLSNDTVDAEILKAITEYADLDNQSDKITAKRTKIRERMEKKHGYSSLAFQEVVRKVKKMVPEFSLPGSFRFNDVLSQGGGMTLKAVPAKRAVVIRQTVRIRRTRRARCALGCPARCRHRCRCPAVTAG